MENVRMVWCDEIEQNAIWTDLANVNPNDYGTIRYDDTFVLTKDGKMYAAGTNIGTDSRRNTPYGEGKTMSGRTKINVRHIPQNSCR